MRISEVRVIVSFLARQQNKGAGPVWWYPMDLMYSNDNRPTDNELAEMKLKLLIELEKLI